MFALDDNYVRMRIINPASKRYHQVGKVIKILPSINNEIGETYILKFPDGAELSFGIRELEIY